MRNLRPLCFLIGLVIGCLQTGFAQQTDSISLESSANQWSEKLAKDLGISPEKVENFKTIHLDYAQQIQKMRSNPQVNLEEKRNKFRGLLLAQRAEIAQLLTDEQYEQYVAKSGNWYRKVSTGE